MDNDSWVYAWCALRSLAEVGLSARTRGTGHCSNAGWLSAVLQVRLYTIRQRDFARGTPHAAQARAGRSRAGQIPFFPGARMPFGSIASLICSWKRRNA